jgi:hypothetical protein
MTGGAGVCVRTGRARRATGRLVLHPHELQADPQQAAQVLSVEATPCSQGGSTCISVPRQRQVSDFSSRWGKAGVSIGQPGRPASGRRLATDGSARPTSRIDAAGRASLRQRRCWGWRRRSRSPGKLSWRRAPVGITFASPSRRRLGSGRSMTPALAPMRPSLRLGLAGRLGIGGWTGDFANSARLGSPSKLRSVCSG